MLIINSYKFVERYWLEQGRNVGEQVVPPVRNFNGIDVESSDNIMVCQRPTEKKMEAIFSHYFHFSCNIIMNFMAARYDICYSCCGQSSNSSLTL